ARRSSRRGRLPTACGSRWRWRRCRRLPPTPTRSDASSKTCSSTRSKRWRARATCASGLRPMTDPSRSRCPTTVPACRRAFCRAAAAAIATQLRWALAGDFEVTLAGDGAAAIRRFEELRPAVVTLDLGLPPDARGTHEGLRVLSEIVRRDPHSKIVVITGNGQEAAALDAIGLGAFDYYRKPIDIEELRVIVQRARHLHHLERASATRQREAEAGGRFEELLGASAPMRELYALIERVAPSNYSVLITGESGTGKELIARAIHTTSPRRTGPFVPINAGAIPETLVESELFGHER